MYTLALFKGLRQRKNGEKYVIFCKKKHHYSKEKKCPKILGREKFKL